MRNRAFVFLIALVPLHATDLSRAPDADLLADYGQLRTVSLDPNRAAVAENFVLKKDAASFQFKTGNLYFFQPVAEHVAGAVFVGEGVFRLKPPAPIERRQLARFNGGNTDLEESFTEAVLLFSDSTFDELSHGLKFRAEAAPQNAVSALDHFRKTFRDDVRINFEAALLAGLCFPKHGMFLADIKAQKHGKLLFLMDQRESEAVQLIHYNNSLDYFDTWSAFVPAGSSPPGAFVHTARVNVDASIGKGRDLSAETRTEFSSLIDGPRMLALHLAPTLRVSKVTWGAAPGRELKFIQEPKKKDADLWVILPEPLAQSQSNQIAVAYEGNEVIKGAGNGNFFVGARDVWYPRLDNPGGTLADWSVYHMKFQTPKEFTLVATGNLVNRRQENKLAVTEWDTELPFPVAGFNYGKFKPKTQKEGAVDVTVYANESIGDELGALRRALEMDPKAGAELGITEGGLNTTGMTNSMLAESINALRVFTHYFGPIPFKTLSITQQPASYFGQSWPTLVFMPYTAFLDATTRNQLGLTGQKGSRDFLQEVGSHEIAHQWWGHLVGQTSYHDEWLSEGFAEYSAGLYIMCGPQGDKKFKTFLETQRNEILQKQANGEPPANSAGPIWMGTQLISEKSRGAYRLIYAKGAYVLHMLRMMQYDFARKDDSRFITMMHDFASTYAGKNASTEDFKTIVDKHFGENMSWFFKQWVYGTEVPQVTVEYSVTDNAKGALLKGAIHQRGVSPDFQIRMPCVLRFKKGGIAGRINAQGETSPFELQLPQHPESIDFNMLDSVLCQLDVKKI